VDCVTVGKIRNNLCADTPDSFDVFLNDLPGKIRSDLNVPFSQSTGNGNQSARNHSKQGALNGKCERQERLERVHDGKNLLHLLRRKISHFRCVSFCAGCDCTKVGHRVGMMVAEKVPDHGENRLQMRSRATVVRALNARNYSFAAKSQAWESSPCFSAFHRKHMAATNHPDFVGHIVSEWWPLDDVIAVEIFCCAQVLAELCFDGCEDTRLHVRFADFDRL
jgi:hypothetical protein